MARVFDMHLHTTRGGSDSSLTPRELVQEARRVGVDGICLTEHTAIWDRRELERLADGTGLVLIRGLELATDSGHVIAFGLDHYPGGCYRARDLHGSVQLVGGFAIAVHPFRRAFDPDYTRFGPRENVRPTLEAATRNPLLEYIDAIEVLNGACSELENLFALAVARRLGRPGTAGSDAHSSHGIACFVTVFDNDIQDEADFLRELKAGRFHAARGLYNGELVPYAMADEDLDANLRLYDVM